MRLDHNTSEHMVRHESLRPDRHSVKLDDSIYRSNLSYIIFGLYMIKDGGSRGSDSLRVVGIASIMVGLTSFAYHASYTAQGQFLDFVGMYMFAVIPIVSDLLYCMFFCKV